MVARYLMVFLGASLLFQASCGPEDPLPPSLICLEEYTIEHRVQVGQAFGAAIDQQQPILSSSVYREAYDYVEQLYQLAVETPTVEGRSSYEWKVSILDLKDASAFILPDGHLYINKGLLQFLETENQLVALMAHEISYVENGDIITVFDNEFDCIFLGDIILDNGNADVPQQAIGVPSLELAENSVLMADSFAIDLICPFVYAPQGVASILQKTIELDTSITWLQRRPGISESRIDRINQLAASCGMNGAENREEYQFFKENWLPE